MEFIPGYDLAELLESRESPFPQSQVLGWADELLKVLEYLPRQDPPILHRDIKPSNLKLRRGRLDAAELWRTDWASYYQLITENGGQTHVVGTKLPNSFGLFDMRGNVWEWRQDWYHDSYSGAPTDGSAWLSGSEQKHRVLRGGSWDNVALYLRSAHRSGSTPNGPGFRVVAVVRTQ